MSTPTLHCVSVIRARRPGARTHTVALTVVVAGSEDEAMHKVASQCSDDEMVIYRNAFDADTTVVWAYQSWTRAEVEESGARRARAIEPVSTWDRERFWNKAVPYFGLDSSFDYDSQPEIMLGYLKAYDKE